MLSLFIFRNDLRLDDNTSLIKALNMSKQVIPIYCLENLKLFVSNNDNNKQFIIETLKELDQRLKKIGSKLLFISKLTDLEKFIINKDKIEAIFLNKLYHPKHILQEKKVEKICKKRNLEFKVYQDFLLHDLNSEADKIYKVYTPFF